MSVVSVVCCLVEVSATGWSLVQRNPTECGVSQFDREASIVRRPMPPWVCRATGGGNGVLVRCLHLIHDLMPVQSACPSVYKVTQSLSNNRRSLIVG
jgi:hypothetical protein